MMAKQTVPGQAAKTADSELEERRRAALAAAERCAALLKTQFGATRAIPFGSVLDAERWTAGSDLDLAIEGVPAECFFAAWASLRQVLPPDLRVDLVDLQSAYPELRARILQEDTMAGGPLEELERLVQDELGSLHRIAADLSQGLASVDELPPSQFEMNGLASYVHQFYTGCERILERIATQVDGDVPKGAFSHANLLYQVAEARAGARPPVISREVWIELQIYLEFRHFFRHAYAFVLEWPKLQPLIDGVGPLLALFERDIGGFLAAMK